MKVCQKLVSMKSDSYNLLVINIVKLLKYKTLLLTHPFLLYK